MNVELVWTTEGYLMVVHGQPWAIFRDFAEAAALLAQAQVEGPMWTK